MKLWRESLAKVNEKAAQSLADPTEYENLFTGLTEAFKAEQFLKQHHKGPIPASKFPSVPVSLFMNLLYWSAFINSNLVTVTKKFSFIIREICLFEGRQWSVT